MTSRKTNVDRIATSFTSYQDSFQNIMASPKSIQLKRDQILTRLNAMKVVPASGTGPNRAARRRMLQNFARQTGIPYAVQRDMIRDVERRMRDHGIDPYEENSYEKLVEKEKSESNKDHNL